MSTQIAYGENAPVTLLRATTVDTTVGLGLLRPGMSQTAFVSAVQANGSGASQWLVANAAAVYAQLVPLYNAVGPNMSMENLQTYLTANPLLPSEVQAMTNELVRQERPITVANLGGLSAFRANLIATRVAAVQTNIGGQTQQTTTNTALEADRANRTVIADFPSECPAGHTAACTYLNTEGKTFLNRGTTANAVARRASFAGLFRTATAACSSALSSWTQCATKKLQAATLGAAVAISLLAANQGQAALDTVAVQTTWQNGTVAERPFFGNMRGLIEGDIAALGRAYTHPNEQSLTRECVTGCEVGGSARSCNVVASTTPTAPR